MLGFAVNWIDWPWQVTVTTPPLLANVCDGGEVVVVVACGGGAVVVGGGAVHTCAVFPGVLGVGAVVATWCGGGPHVPDKTVVRTVGWPGGTEDAGAVAVVAVVTELAGDVGGGDAWPAGGWLIGRPAATEADLTKVGAVDEAVTLAMPEDTPNQATAVAVAVPSAQVVIAMDRRTTSSVHP